MKTNYRFFLFEVISQQQQQLQQQHFDQNIHSGSVELVDVPAQYDNIQPGHVPTKADAASSEKAMSMASSHNDVKENV